VGQCGVGVGVAAAHFFRTYVEQKQQAWKTYAVNISGSHRAPVCNSVIR